ncbi:hypothetical protein JD969_00275 [Planctomycetota bacterium]|nr:hypothetical protein JD969_00275 [Planctomycetota bacterium]
MQKKFRAMFFILLMGLSLVVNEVCSAQEVTDGVTVSPRVPIAVKVGGKNPDYVRGEIMSWFWDGVMVVRKDRSAQRSERVFVKWDHVPEGKIYSLFASHFFKNDEYGAWVKLGKLLATMKNGTRFARMALAKAETLDTDAFQYEFENKTAQEAAVELWRTAHPVKKIEAEEETPRKRQKRKKAVPDAPPVAEELLWEDIEDDSHEAILENLRTFAKDGLAKVGAEMFEVETDYFLFYTDLNRNEAKKWSAELDRMYVRLADLFGVAKGRNIWRGKCLIFVFSKERKFHEFESKVYGVEFTPANGKVLGRCYQRANGDVHVVFYRQQEDSLFARILVHEASHGFLFRYRSKARVPSCWNEGLADTIADMLLPRFDLLRARQAMGVKFMRDNGNPGGGFFEAEHIQPMQYGIASKLTQYMIKQDKKRYVNFINAIKSGVDWQLALAKYYGVDEHELMLAFGEFVGVNELKPYSKELKNMTEEQRRRDREKNDAEQK